MHSNIDGESLSPAEVASFFILLVIAGNDTTRNAISHGLLAFAEHPDQRALWQADPIRRIPYRRRGDRALGVTHHLDAAHRGPAHHTRAARIWSRVTSSSCSTTRPTATRRPSRIPTRFDVRRSPNPHVGFGAAGPHYCLGAHLARQEIAVLFRQLFERLPDIAVSAEPDHLRSTFINGIKHMDCAFTPVDRPR